MLEVNGISEVAANSSQTCLEDSSALLSTTIMRSLGGLFFVKVCLWIPSSNRRNPSGRKRGNEIATRVLALNSSKAPPFGSGYLLSPFHFFLSPSTSQQLRLILNHRFPQAPERGVDSRFRVNAIELVCYAGLWNFWLPWRSFLKCYRVVTWP
jgi:hypothetical protein